MKFVIIFLNVLLASFSLLAHAATFSLPPGDHKIVGEVFNIQSQPHDTLYKIGKRYDLGIYEMIEANPKIKPDWELVEGTKITIPNQFILPATADGQYKGLFINLAELRLYYYPPGKNEVKTYPVGIGKRGWQTPVTPDEQPARVTEMVENPTWRPTKKMQKAHFKLTGQYYPDEIAAGETNPLGYYKIRTSLDRGTYLIHGTNDQNSVGLRVSSGCIRLWTADIQDLFTTIMAGKTIPKPKAKAAKVDNNSDSENKEKTGATPEPVKLITSSVWLTKKEAPEVRIINAPYQVGVANNQVLFAAHVPLSDDKDHPRDDIAKAIELLSGMALQNNYYIHWETAEAVARALNGIPTVVGYAN
ncbi:MAG: L,D-transpeptidase family protein [Legionellales bacterium]|nr:L,D-transpeptidase family protein [Legionellales bacterium]